MHVHYVVVTVLRFVTYSASTEGTILLLTILLTILLLINTVVGEIIPNKDPEIDLTGCKRAAKKNYLA